MKEEYQPLDLFFADMHQPTTDAERDFFATLMAQSRQGHLCIEHHLEAVTSPFVQQVGDLFYLKRNYIYETRILEAVQHLSGPSDVPVMDAVPQLTSEQNEALRLALSNNLSIIEGGPGTGKTYLVSHLIRAMGSSAKIILAAPTGKAAARLKQFNGEVTCGTLHAILGIKSERDFIRMGSYVHADLIVVDESSMIDVRLWAFFLGSLRLGQRVVFLGDGNQLPPVEAGSIFADLVDLLPTAHLRTSLRSDRRQVLQIAENILAGQMVSAHHSLSEQFLLNLLIEKSDRQSLSILSPLREGPWGVDQLNQKIHLHLTKIVGHRLEVPILITRSDHEAGLYNGDTALLIDQKKAVFSDGRVVDIAQLPPYEFAYVMSVHKSQGSEFDTVVVLIPPGSEAFGREILYTAVTRARIEVIICGDAETIAKTVAKTSRRRSGLKVRWSQT